MRNRGCALATMSAVPLLLGCSDLFGPALPDGAMPLTPRPPEYAPWWSIVESCSGMQAALADVDWWVVPGRLTIEDGHDAAGRYQSGKHRIVVAEGVAHDGFLVRHEMLHAVLGVHRLSGHPKHFFEARCGGVISCGGDCLAEVGGPPPGILSAPRVDPDDIEVSVRLVPQLVNRGPGSWGCTTIVVSATNGGSNATVMDIGRAGTFRWILEGWGAGSGGGPLPPNDLVLLDPGDARSYAYDCPAHLAELEAGEYVFRGQWERVRSEAVILSIAR